MPPERSVPRPTTVTVGGKEKHSKKNNSPLLPLDELAAFKVLPILFTCTALQQKQPTTTHYLYFKKHDSKKLDPRTPANRTLFLLNLPIDATEEHVRRLFRHCGKVESVHFHTSKKNRLSSLTSDPANDETTQEGEEEEEEEWEEWAGISSVPVETKPKSTKKKESSQSSVAPIAPRRILPSGAFAHVVFFEESAIPKALNMNQRKRIWGEDVQVGGEEEGSVQPLGYKGYLNQYHTCRPPLQELQASVDAFMENYAAKEKLVAEAEKAVHNVVDDDGFVLVTRKGRRNANTDGEGTTVTAVRNEEIKRLEPKKKKELVDFYRFQMREAKKDKLAELRRKFEEDKEKIIALKSQRRFKPY